MATFEYTSTRKMDPVAGRTFSTEYYKQSHRERQRTEQFVQQQLERIGNLAIQDSEYMQELLRPIPKFKKKESQGCYSAGEIIADMYEQLKSGKDIPSGMLGRWNRLFEGTGYEIEMVPQQPVSNTFHSIFQAA